MPLLLQLNGDIPERFPGHERRLYVFGCKANRCRRRDGSVRAVRGVRLWEGQYGDIAKNGGNTVSSAKSEEVAIPVREAHPALGLGDTIFGTKGASSMGSAHSNSFSSKISSPMNGSVNPFSAPSQERNSFFTGPSSPSPQNAPSPATVESDLSTTFAQKARLSSSQHPSTTPTIPQYEQWPTDPPPSYPPSHLDAAYETLDPPSSTSHSSSKGSKTSLSIASASAAGAEPDDGKDGVEMNIDSTFQKFADRVAQNPEQVLRYEFAGQPLLYHKDDPVGRISSEASSSMAQLNTSSIAGRLASTSAGRGGGGGGLPACGHCGSQRVFELQLMPHAITELEREQDGVDGMEWGTVVVGVCGSDCADVAGEAQIGKTSWREEWVGVQWEEEIKRK